MSDEKIKQIILTLLDEDDSCLLQPIFDIVSKINLMENEKDTSVGQLLGKEQNTYTSKQLFTINRIVLKVCKELNIELDFEKNKNKIVGLPYNFTFIKK